MKILDRRTMLKGSGVALALPLLEAMVPAKMQAAVSDKPARRMVAIDLGFGLLADQFFPKTGGHNYEVTPYLKIFQDFRKDFTVISGTSHPDVDGGHPAAKSFLTCAPKPRSASYKNTISVDQVAAEKIGLQTRYGYLALSTGGGSLSHSRNGVGIPSITKPSILFSQLFLEGKPAEKIRQVQRLKDRQSVLDVVLDKARALEKGVGSVDRQRLDQYFTSVREAEQRFNKAEEWEHKPKPTTSIKPPVDITNGADVIGRARLMYEMVHLAIQSDSTRLITLYNTGVNAVPPVSGVTQDYHMLSHHGRDPERLAQLQIVEMEQLRALAELLDKLRSTPEGSGNLLDHTMVFFSSDLGNGSSHDNHNLPVIFAGGGFQHGQHLAFDTKNNCPLANLYVSMLQRLGLDIDKFGSSTGTMTGLEMKG